MIILVCGLKISVFLSCTSTPVHFLYSQHWIREIILELCENNAWDSVNPESTFEIGVNPSMSYRLHSDCWPVS